MLIDIPSTALTRLLTVFLGVSPGGAGSVAPQTGSGQHWPVWLRILVVIGLVVFVRLVAGMVKQKPSGPGPS